MYKYVNLATKDHNKNFQPYRMRATERQSLSFSIYAGQNGSDPFLLLFFFLLFLLPEISTIVEAQSGSPDNGNQYPYARFSPSMAVIIAVLLAALFFMGFFSIYIRHCSDASGAAGSVGRALSLRARRAAAARGLDRSVLETFPTFSYSEVKDHKIGKGALECAVCLNEFEEDETLRLLPKCDHVFHPECIDAWLESHVTCPVCRANLTLQAGDEPDPTTTDHEEIVSNSRNEEIVIQVDDDQQQQGRTGRMSRNSSFENSNRPQRSWSMKRPSIFGFGKFRSHSTGHSLVQPGENLERFTLRLPEGVRKEVMNRAKLNRARSFATVLPTEGSSRRGYRTGGEGSNRAGRFYQKIELPDRDIKSDRWGFFTRGLSFRSPRVKAETGEGSTSKSGGGSRTPVKMPSFKCLEPKADGGDENRPISGQTPV